MRYPPTLCSILVNNPGGGSGSGTVQTDGVTIQGDGSSGNKIAIKQVETDATITGAGTVASPLSAVTQTPPGWPVPFYSYGVLTTAGNVLFTNTLNTLNVWGLEITTQVQFSTITLFIGVADAVNSYDFGFYNLAGTRVAHIGAQTIPSTGLQSFAVVSAPITINPGVYFFAGTGNAATAAFVMNNDTHGGFYRNLNASYGSSSGGALPTSITPPAKSVTTSNRPYFCLN